uniref:Putative secreted protein n=1 Tax=Ixodes ricinus TaxID=34613 RepID=A0A6B0UL33_IXORI
MRKVCRPCPLVLLSTTPFAEIHAEDEGVCCMRSSRAIPSPQPLPPPRLYVSTIPPHARSNGRNADTRMHGKHVRFQTTHPKTRAKWMKKGACCSAAKPSLPTGQAASRRFPLFS